MKITLEEAAQKKSQKPQIPQDINVGRGNTLPKRKVSLPAGDKEVSLTRLSAGSYVTKAALEVRGMPFDGPLNIFQGVNVLPSPVVYDLTGAPQELNATNDRAFIIDFKTVCSIIKIEVAGHKIKLLLSWLGTDFSPKSAFPFPAVSQKGQFFPKADGTGKDVVKLTGIETSKLFVQIDGNSLTAESFMEKCSISTATYPSNVKASINGRPPFWTNPGVLDKEARLLGLAEDLNAYLADIQEETDIKLTLNTDSPGVFAITLINIGVEFTAEAVWGGQPTFDANVKALESQVLNIPFPNSTDKSWRINRLELELAGQFPPWRAFSDPENDIPGKLGMKVNSRFSVARQVQFREPAELFGFCLLIRSNSKAAELSFEVFEGSEELSVSGQAITSVGVSLPANSTNSAQWCEVFFPSPVKISKNKAWLAVKAKSADIEWVGASENSGAGKTLYSDEGGQWQEYPVLDNKAVLAQIRVLRQPFAKENTPLLDIRLDKEETAALEVSEDSSSLSIIPKTALETAPVDGTVSLPLTIMARSSGVLTLKKVTAYYEEKD